ncbi:MAG: phosphatidylglycerol lysyltransferase domain-containing protein [Negativicutes bacterium]|nr:phosphatidylglycerol lysyltransferase domain-containing protein [Negativicutes bacterium]
MRGFLGGFTILLAPVKLEDKGTIDGFFRKRRYEASECTFTNLYVWRNAYNIRWAVVAGMLCVTLEWENKLFFLPPYGDDANLGKAVAAMADYCRQSGLRFLIKGATKDQVKLIDQALPGQFAFERDRDNDDYVHSTRELIELKGRKFSSKVNHIHHFRYAYPDYRFELLTPSLAAECLVIANEWRQKKDKDDCFLRLEFAAVKDALEHYQELKLIGGAILVHGRVEAFSLGEALNSDTVVVHVEKANSDIRGAYQIINQECCRYCWPQYAYVNREEDMGIPGLRRAKESYRPIRMIEKYDVRLLRDGDESGSA